MLAYAIDTPAPSTIVLVSGDRDFAYALSILNLRRYRTVLVTLPNAHTSLTFQASICFDWFKDIVNPPGPFYLRNRSNGRQLFQHDEPGSSSIPAPDNNGYEASNFAPQDEPVDIMQYLGHRKRRQSSFSQSPSPYLGRSRQAEVQPCQSSNVVQPSTTNVSYSRRQTMLPNTPMHFAGPHATVSSTSGSTITGNAKCSLAGATGGKDMGDDEEATKELPPVLEEASSCPNELREGPGLTIKSESSSQMQLADNPTVEGLNPSPHPCTLPVSGIESMPAFETTLPRPSSPVTELDLDALGLVAPAISDAEIRQIMPSSSIAPFPSTSVDGMEAGPAQVPESYSPGSIFSAPSLRSNIANMMENEATLNDQPSVSTPSVKNSAPTPEDQPLDSIPVIFCPLFHSLELHHRKGHSQPLRSVVGAELAKEENLYQRAGVRSFKEYIALAEKRGIVTCGGYGGYAWVSFKLSWENVVVVA